MAAVPHLLPFQPSQGNTISAWFEPNQGQAAPGVLFISPGPRHRLLIERAGTQLLFQGRPGSAPSTVRFAYTGAVGELPQGGEPLPGQSNYLSGADQNHWKIGIPHYRTVRRTDLWPGIDQTYYSGEQGLEYDFIVRPGANPARIAFVVEGAQSLAVNAAGDLVMEVDHNQVRQHKPFAYQLSGGQRQPVPASYRLGRNRTVSFTVGPYDHDKSLIIDPVLSYSTYLSGYTDNRGYAVAVDAAGNTYVTGTTMAGNFPVQGALQALNGGGSDAFVAKLNSAGNSLVYATYLGGNGDDTGYGIAVDGSGNAYVTGSTRSTNFPVQSPYQRNLSGGSDAFLTELNAAGNALIFSTYLGGSADDVAQAVAVSGGTACITGGSQSSDFPRLNPFQGSSVGGGDAFVACFASGALQWSTYLGGSAIDYAYGVAMDSARNVYVGGYTSSADFPLAIPLQAAIQGARTGFITKLNAAGTALVYSTYLGGNSWDEVHGIALDATGAAYVTGSTFSANFPTTPGAFSAIYKYANDGFVSKISPAGTSLVYSTFLAGTGEDIPWAIAVDAIGNAHVTGLTTSNDFPSVSPVQAAIQGNGVKAAKSTDGGAAWTPISAGILGQTVTGIAVDPTNPNKIFAIGQYAQLYLSLDASQTWTPVNTGSYANSCANSVAIAPSNSNYIYLGTCSNGVARSADGGTTWSPFSNGLVPGNSIYVLLADPTNPALMYAAGNNGSLYKARTSDSSWTSITTSLATNINAIAIDPTVGSTIYLGTDAGIYKSTQSGPFNPINTGVTPQKTTALLIQPGAPSVLYAGQVCAVIKSTNAGASWASASSGIPNTCIWGGGLVAIGGTLYVGTDTPGIYKSTDGGSTWALAGSGLGNPPRALTAAGSILYAGFYAGQDSFVGKLNVTGTALLYSTWFGGLAPYDEAHGIAIDSTGNAYVAGWTGQTIAPNLPTTPGAFQTTLNGWNNVFLAKFADTSCQYSASSAPISVGSNGGLGNVAVTAGSGCAWLAAGAPGWISLVGGNPGIGNSSVSYTIQPNPTPNARSAALWIAGRTITVSQAAGASCNYVPGSSSASAPVPGGAGGVTVTAPAGCQWTATTAAPWVTLNAGQAGTGSGLVAYTVAANNTLAARSTTITIAGQTFTLNQPAATCSYTLSSPSSFVSADGASTTVTVTASPVVCAWSAAVSTGGSWLTITENPSSIDPTKVIFSAARNTGAARTGTITIAGQTLTVAEAGTGAPVYFTFTRQSTGRSISDNDAQLIDIDGDGYPDYVITPLASPEGTFSPVLAYRNNGNFTFTDATSTFLPASPQVQHVRRIEVADFNADGRPDLIIADHGTDAPPFPGGQSELLLGSATNTLTSATSANIPQELRYSHYVTVGDINGDGKTDYVMAQAFSSNGCGVAAYLNNGSGVFTRTQSGFPASLLTCSQGSYAAQLIDVNKDGSLDLVLAGDPNHSDQPGDVLLLNDGKGNFTPAPANAMPNRKPTTLFNAIGYATADFDNDGWPDLLAVQIGPNYTNSSLQLLLNNGDGTFRDATNHLPTNWIPSPVSANWIKFVQPIDFNGDGYIDLLVRGNFGSSTILLNTGRGQFVDVKDLMPTGIVSDSWFDFGPSLNAGDLNKDGKPDLVTLRWNTEMVIGQNVNPLPKVTTCGYAVSTTAPATVPISGAAVSLIVTAGSGCRWIVSPDTSWITAATPGVFSGNGSTTLNVAPSYSGLPRSGTVIVAGQKVTVTQAANACAVVLPSTSITAAAGGGSSTLNISSFPSDCVSSVSSSAPWLTVTSGAASGAVAVAYSVAANPGSTSRTGTLTMGGQTFAVTQTGAPACDINGDGNINVADVQIIINEALGVAPAVHDVNGDGVVNVADVQIVINAALGLGCKVS